MHKFINLVLFAVLCFACSSISHTLIPTHHGVEDDLKVYVKDYKDLANINHITFKNIVVMGFSDIDQGDIIGLCTYGLAFHQIDIDMRYWHSATETSRMSLMYHELTHCYCNRGHDWAKGKEYPSKSEDRLRAQLSENQGYYNDGCPTTLMHPILVGDSCTLIHYNDYVKEMFDRCDPY